MEIGESILLYAIRVIALALPQSPALNEPYRLVADEALRDRLQMSPERLRFGGGGDGAATGSGRFFCFRGAQRSSSE